MSRYFFILLFFHYSSLAQKPGGGFKNPQDSSQRERFSSGKVFGSVADSLTGIELEFASVALIRMNDSMPVGGSLSNSSGKFSIEQVLAGRYMIKVTCIGYSQYSGSPFKITPAQPTHDLGRIFINPSAKKLKEAQAVGEKSEYVNSLDRKVYNLEKNIVNTGGTATEVLQNIPSVTVDMDGNISLRGSGNVTVLVDGRPSGITGSTRQAVLQQIPASSIDRIEVITNPSARYDADGLAGIINIITKKDKLKGLNGNFSAGIGTNEKYNLATGANYRTGKFNLYGNYSFRHEKRNSTSESERYNYYADSVFYNLSDAHSSGINDAHAVKGGLDIYLSGRSTLGLGGTYTSRRESRPEYVIYEVLNAAREQTSSFIRENEDNNKNQSMDYTIDFRKLFKKRGRELNAGATYSLSDRDNNKIYNTYSNPRELELIQFQNTVSENSTGTIQTDYTHPFSDNSKLAAGWKSIYRSIDAIGDGEYYLPSTNTTDVDSRFVDEFIYDEQIHAVYIEYTGKRSKFEYQAGVRGEDYINSGTSRIANLNFRNDYLNLYPSAFVKYHLPHSQEVQASYSRRVNRPESRSMNPFIDYSDSLNIRKGNPEIQPEFIDSYELSYLRTFEKHSVNVTGYYRYTSNLISRFRFIDQSTNITTFTFLNFSSARNIGGEVVIKNQVSDFLSVMTSGNIYQNTVDAGNIESELQSVSTNWNIRTSINAKLTKTTSFQVTGMYMAPHVGPQGTFKGMSGIDAGVKQDMWKGRAWLSLNVTDIFNTRKMVIRTTGNGYSSENRRSRESRVAMLSFSYRIGTVDYNQRKKSQRSQQQQENQNMMDED